MPELQYLKSDEELALYSEIEYVRFFGEFGQGIEYIEALEKRLRRKKITHTLDLEFFKNHLKNNEQKYFVVLKELFENDEESQDQAEINNRKLIKQDLSFFVHNKYGVTNYLFEWEMELVEEYQKNKGETK